VPKTNRKVLVLLITLGAVATAILASGWYSLQQGLLQQMGGAPTGGLAPGALAPDFTLTDLDGNAICLGDFRGKVILIDFMATWCGPCRQQMPHLKAVWEKEEYKGKVVIISIDVDPRVPVEDLESYRQGYPYATWIWAKDTAEQGVAASYGVRAIPTIVIIDQEGYVMFVHVGVTDASTLIREIDSLLGRAG